MNKEYSYKKKISNKLNIFIDKELWEEAKVLLEKEIKKFPKEYFLISSLSKIYYNLNLFDIALDLAKKAMIIEPNDVMVMYDYACALSANDQEKEAMKIFDLIINKDINEIAYGKYGEGLKWAKSIKNDSRMRIALCLIELGNYVDAIIMINKHIKYRQRGIYSDFTKKFVISKKEILS